MWISLCFKGFCMVHAVYRCLSRHMRIGLEGWNAISCHGNKCCGLHVLASENILHLRHLLCKYYISMSIHTKSKWPTMLAGTNYTTSAHHCLVVWRVKTPNLVFDATDKSSNLPFLDSILSSYSHCMSAFLKCKWRKMEIKSLTIIL